MLKIKAKCSQFILFLSIFQMNCIIFYESDLDPDGLLSQLLLLSRLGNSSLASEPILTRSLYGYTNGTKAFFQWHKVPDATSYKLHYSTSETVSRSDSSSPETTEPWILLDGLDTSTLYYFQLYATLSNGNQVTHKQSYPAFTNPVPFGTSSTVSAVNISAGQGLESGKYGVLNVNPYTNKIHVSTQNGETPGARIPSFFNCNPDGSNCSFQNLTIGNTNGGDEARPHSTIDFHSEKLIYVSTNTGSTQTPSLFICPLDGSNCTYQDISAGQGNSSGLIPYVIINPLNGEILTLTRNIFLSTNGTLSLFRCDNQGANCNHKDISGPDRYLSTFERSSSFISPYNGKLYTVIPDHPSGKPRLYISDLDGSNANSLDISATASNTSGDVPNLLLDHINSKLIVVTNDFNARVGFFICDLDGSNCSFRFFGTNNLGASPSAVLDLINNKVLIYTENADPVLGNARLLLFRCNLDGSSCESSVDISAAASLGGPALIDNSGYRPTARIEPRTGKILISTENFSATPASIPYLFIH